MDDWHSCMACDVTAGRIAAPGGTILADEHWLCDHAVEPCLMEMWLILRPRRHVEHIADLIPEEMAGLGGHLARLSRAMMGATALRKVYVCSFGEVVKHVHFYLLPIREGLPHHGREVLERMQSGVWTVGKERAAQAADAVREQLGMMQTIPPPPLMPTNLQRNSAFADSIVESRRMVQTSPEIPHHISADRHDPDTET